MRTHRETDCSETELSFATSAIGRERSITSNAIDDVNSREYFRGIVLYSQFQLTPTIVGWLSTNRRAGQSWSIRL